MILFRSLLLSLAVVAAPALADSGKLIAPLGKGTFGARTEVMVLGTPHLAGWPKDYDTKRLAPLLDRLAAYRPDIITIEALSGRDCDQLKRYAATIPDAWEQYCWDTDAARKATGLDVPEAVAAVEKTLAAWPATPTAADRRKLAALFSAANDRTSALVQWLRLAPTDRHAGDGLDAALVEMLDKRAIASNENYQIAAVLAARLGLERVYPTDDHSADSITGGLGDDFGKALTDIWASANAQSGWLKDFSSKPPADGDILGYYRATNGAHYLKTAISNDFGVALKDQSASKWGRQYVAWWETRNLRMIANIRAAFGNRPGARVLSIVGSSHKPYFDAYLGLMHDVRVQDTERFLK